MIKISKKVVLKTITRSLRTYTHSYFFKNKVRINSYKTKIYLVQKRPVMLEVDLEPKEFTYASLRAATKNILISMVERGIKTLFIWTFTLSSVDSAASDLPWKSIWSSMSTSTQGRGRTSAKLKAAIRTSGRGQAIFVTKRINIRIIKLIRVSLQFQILTLIYSLRAHSSQ